MNRDVFRRLIADHTVEVHPTICPEILVRETPTFVGLWEVSEKLSGSQVEPPFWACSWPGSQAIARYVLDRPELIRGKVILDLGCGNGLAAIACARSGAARVLAGDVDQAALWMTAENAETNGLSLECVLDDLLARLPPVPPVEVILAGDLFYARELAGRVRTWLRASLAAGAEVLVGDPGRAYLPDSGLELLATYDVPVSPEIESVTLRSTRVYRMTL
jgi:predicted nicotinamide N-methyase